MSRFWALLLLAVFSAAAQSARATINGTASDAQGAVVVDVKLTATGTCGRESSLRLETRTSGVSQLVESKTIEEMPPGDRHAMNMVNITGGAYSSGCGLTW